MEPTNPDSNRFQYTYSAREQAELRRIRDKYAPGDPIQNKMAYLRRLDAGVTRRAATAALILGVLGCLVLGVGMSLILSDFAAILGAWRAYALPIGTGIGLVGLTAVMLAYPLYRTRLRRERRRVSPEILRLTNELIK